MGPDLWEMVEDGKADDEVAAIIRLGHFQVLPEGVRVVSQFGNIVTVRLTRRDLPRVAGSAEVADMTSGDKQLLGPDLEFEAAGAPELSTELLPTDERRPAHVTASGRGTVIGVVDWGFDIAHPSLRNTDGSTRLLALWDQRGGRRADSPQPFGYGVLHDREALDRALKEKDPYGALHYHPADADPGRGCHGTHVASIAAGTGTEECPTGVAPEADLILVHNAPWDPTEAGRLGDSVTLLEAIDFIARLAGDRPWVINLSMGCHADQHDGSTHVERALDAVVRAAPGRAVCMSAGNYFNKKIHASGHLRPTEERTFVWNINTGKKPSDYNQLQIWYSWQDQLEVILRSPDGTISARTKAGERAKLMSGSTELGNMYHRGQEPDTLDNHVNIFFYKEAPPGEWTVTLVGSDVIDGRFHAWIEREVSCPPCQSRFADDDADPHSTTGTICNGRRTLAVGAYNNHDPEHKLAPFSSVGPTRDGRLKPDLCAPGVGILAARSAARSGTVPPVVRMSGTSMAAPCVTGTVALMFQAAPRRLRIEETHNILLENTLRVAVPEEIPDRIGIGFLDVERAVEGARKVSSSGRTFRQITVRARAGVAATPAPGPKATPAVQADAGEIAPALPAQAADFALPEPVPAAAETGTPVQTVAAAGGTEAMEAVETEAAAAAVDFYAAAAPAAPVGSASLMRNASASEGSNGLSACGNVVVWINAFIPRSVPGYTFTIARGPYTGATAIPCPVIALPVNPSCLSRGYLTDQRSFDAAPAASHRMRSTAEISLFPPMLVSHSGADHTTSGTTEIDKTTGALTCIKNADLARCLFRNFRVEPDPAAPLSGNFTIYLDVVGQAADPCVNLAADIDYAGTISVFCSPFGNVVEVAFNGLIDSFPAFEMYASFGGITQTLFLAPPPPGNTVVNLLGAASVPVGGRARFDQCRLFGIEGESVGEAPAPAPRGALDLVERANGAVWDGIQVPATRLRGGPSLMDAVFSDVLLRSGDARARAWEIFDSIVYAGRDRLREAIEDHFELLAAPGAQLRVDLRPGDVLLRRAPGTQMHIAVLGGRELLEPAAFARQGWTAEGRQPGRYAVVIEGGGCPHLRADNFARRVAADDGRLPANQMILRPLAQSDAAERLDTTSLLLGMTVAGGMARPAAPPEPAAPAKPAEPPELADSQEGTEQQAAGACAKDLSAFGQQERARELKAGRHARPQVVGGKPLCPGQLDLVQSGPDGGTIDLLLWNFDIDGAYPKLQHEAALDRLVFELHQRLRGATAKAANYTIFLSGFASRTGDVAYNRKLADERETVVQNYLTAHLEQFKAAGEPAITANVVFDKNPGGFDPDAPPSIESPHSRSVRIVAVPAGKPPPPPRPFPVATIEIVLDDDNDTKVDGGSPVATFVRFGLWNHGYDAAGNIKNAEAERDNFIGNDSRRFYFRVKDGAAKSDVLTVRWSTLAADGKTADDEPAVRDVTVQRVAAGKDVFVSKAVMLVTDDTDVKQPTHSGLAAPHPDAGVRNRGQSNHRLRRARLDGFVKVEYQPVGDPAVSVSLPLFERGKSEERKRVKLRVINYGAKATVGEIAAQVTHANSRWNQIGYTIEAAATVDRPVPAAALDANGLYSGSANNPQEQAALTDLLPGAPDNTITVVFVPLTGANAYTTVGQRNTVALGDRFFVFMNTALDPNNETLAHELSHVLFNRFDDATAQRFFTLNTNPPVAFGVPLPDVRIYRRIQDQHTADPNNDAAHANVINWARRTRTARFPPEAGVGPAATATTGNKLSEAF